MFGRLKDKLKGALNVFSKEVAEEADVVEETVKEEVVDEPEVAEEVKEEKKPKSEPKKDEKKIEEKPDSKKEELNNKVVGSDKSEKKEEAIKEKKVEEKKPESEKEKEKVEVEKPIPNVEEKEDEPVIIEHETSTEDKVEEILEDAKEVVEEVIAKEEEPVKKKSFLGKVFGKREKVVEDVIEEPVVEKATIEDEPEVEETVEEKEEVVEEEKPVEQSPEKQKRRGGLFSKLTRVTLTEEKFESLFWDLEVALLENNVAVEVIEKIKEDLKQALNGEKASKKSIDELILETLHNTLKEILSVKPLDLLALADEKKKEGKPLIITMIGVNGSGKTTTLAKMVKYFQNNNKSLVVAAADTFRAAAIHQLEEHTMKLGVKLIKHDYHADPAAVAYDAVKHATAKNIDIVLIDSAGRLHSNDNLMNELKKLIRINEPDVNIFVGEAITGNDCVEQATLFDEAVGIDAIILAKADVDEKGGAAISASFVTGKPVIFLGVGQSYDDLQVFDPELVLESLDL